MEDEYDYIENLILLFCDRTGEDPPIGIIELDSVLSRMISVSLITEEEKEHFLESFDD